MPTIDSNLSTLANIRTKVRRLTRSPSTAQIADAEIDNYINTFVIYDFPEQLRLFNLRTTFAFYTDSYVDTYDTNTTDANSALYNFNNRYITVHDPAYIAGNKSALYQDRESFYNSFPTIIQLTQIATGDGATTTYSGTLSGKPVLVNNVLFTSVDAFGNGIALKDSPLAGPNHDATLLDTTSGAVSGTLNYVTGIYSFTFSAAPATGKAVYVQSFPYQATIPRAILFYNGKFVLRPIPDQPYKIEMDAYLRPTELLNAPDTPELSEWWQYISYGAAIKIFQDRMDQESVQALMPEFKNQEILILRRTIIQNSNERVATIFTEQEFFGPNNPFGGGGGLL